MVAIGSRLMDLLDRVGVLKAEKMKAMEAALSQNNAGSLVSNSKELERIIKVESQIREVSRMLDHLECEVNEPEVIASEPGISAKKQGKIARQCFVGEIKKRGLEVHLKKGQLYLIQGKLVGIAYASERTPNKWFLGLPIEDYDAIVLLCKDDTGRTTKLILPKGFYEKHKNYFSKGQYKDQIKFNVSGLNGRFAVKLTGKDPIDVTEYIDTYEYLEHPPVEDARTSAQTPGNANTVSDSCSRPLSPSCATDFLGNEPAYITSYREMLQNPNSLPSRMRSFIDEVGSVSGDELRKVCVKQLGCKSETSGSIGASLKVLELDGHIRITGRARTKKICSTRSSGQAG